MDGPLPRVALGGVALAHRPGAIAAISRRVALGFYLLLWLVFPRLPVAARFALAIGIEAGWELFENTPFIIDRYRQQALAQGYSGDGVTNSVFDTLASGLGFVLARTMPVWTVIGLAVGLELLAAFMIRDNLTLNIIQLIYPSEFISNWQASW